MPKKATVYHHRGVTTEPDGRGKFYGRYTLPDGKRPRIKPAVATPEEAYAAAASAQREVDRLHPHVTLGRQMTVNELIDDHWLATTEWQAPATRGRRDSHLGDGTGKPRRKGRKNDRAARFAIRYVFGQHKLSDLNKQMIVSWQDEMAATDYLDGSLNAKRSLLRQILQYAVDQGWLDVNWLVAAGKPRRSFMALDPRPTFSWDEYQDFRLLFLGEISRLIVDLGFDSGLRKNEIWALQPQDLHAARPHVNARLAQPAWVHIRRSVSWGGKKYENPNGGDDAKPWSLGPTKSRKPRRVPISDWLYERLSEHVAKYDLRPTDMLFDYARLRAEHDALRELDPRPERFPVGRYENRRTGKSGEHGKYSTYDLGCRCPSCRNDYATYRYWRARANGRPSITPWREPGYFEDRHGVIEPIDPYWFERAVWGPAARKFEELAGWKPKMHDMRHTMLTWADDLDVPHRDLQRDAGHARRSQTEDYFDSRPRLSGVRVGAFQQQYEGLGLTVKVPSIVDLPERSGPVSPMAAAFDAYVAALTAEDKAILLPRLMERLGQ